MTTIFYILCGTYYLAISAQCTLPAEIQNSNWLYQSTTVVSFGTSNMQGLVFRARGEDLDDFNCISNTGNVYVLKSEDYSNRGETSYLYMCVKLTKVSNDLFYFYLLADTSQLISPNDRIYVPDTEISDSDSTCTYCNYTTDPPDDDKRILQREGTSDTPPTGITACLPCNATCDTAQCTLPAEIQNSNWLYQSTTMVSFGTSNMQGLVFRARGEDLDDFKCISNTGNVYVLKSVGSYSNRGESRYLYMCVKLTKVTKDLFYFYLLADTSQLITPNDRIYVPDTLLTDSNPTCTFCQYTTDPPDDDERILQREGINETLSTCITACLPCEKTCDTGSPSDSCADKNGACQRKTHPYTMITYCMLIIVFLK